MLTFRAVAGERSFWRAARTLALSQSPVSNQVAALEREIGVRLLARAPGGLRPTHEGEITRDQLAIRALVARGLAVTLVPPRSTRSPKGLAGQPTRRSGGSG